MQKKQLFMCQRSKGILHLSSSARVQMKRSPSSLMLAIRQESPDAHDRATSARSDVACPFCKRRSPVAW